MVYGKEALESPRTASLSLFRCFSAPVTVSLLVKVESTPPPAGPVHPQRDLFLSTQGTCSLCLQSSILVVAELCLRVNYFLNGQTDSLMDSSVTAPHFVKTLSSFLSGHVGSS